MDSRTMLLNIHILKWNDELLKTIEIPASLLPEVVASSHMNDEVADIEQLNFYQYGYSKMELYNSGFILNVG